MIYRGYKIENNPNKVHEWWDVYERLVYVEKWIWCWAYRSLEEAKHAIDNHLTGKEGNIKSDGEGLI